MAKALAASVYPIRITLPQYCLPTTFAPTCGRGATGSGQPCVSASSLHPTDLSFPNWPLDCNTKVKYCKGVPLHQALHSSTPTGSSICLVAVSLLLEVQPVTRSLFFYSTLLLTLSAAPEVLCLGICITEQKGKNTPLLSLVLDWKASQLLQLFQKSPAWIPSILHQGLGVLRVYISYRGPAVDTSSPWSYGACGCSCFAATGATRSLQVLPGDQALGNPPG